MTKKIYIQLIIVIFLCAGAAFAQSAKKIAPCQMLTKTAAEKILGKKVRLQPNKKNDITESCTYSASDRRSKITVIFKGFSTVEEAETEDREMNSLSVQNGTTEAVSEIGDDAWFWRSSDDDGLSINVLKKNFTFEISVSGRKISSAELKSVAKRIAAKL